MESIARDVKNLESDERRLFESVVGHSLQAEKGVRTNPVRHKICAALPTPRKWYCAYFLGAHNLPHGRQAAGRRA